MPKEARLPVSFGPICFFCPPYMHSKSAKKDGMYVSHLATTAPALLCCRCHGLKVGFNMATSTCQAAPPHKTAPALLCCRCHGGSLPRPSRSPTDSTSTTMLPVLQTKFMNNYISFNVYIITPVPFMMSVNPPWFHLPDIHFEGLSL